MLSFCIAFIYIFEVSNNTTIARSDILVLILFVF